MHLPNHIYYKYDFRCCYDNEGKVMGTYTLDNGNVFTDAKADAALDFAFDAYIYQTTVSMTYTVWARGGSLTRNTLKQGTYNYSKTLTGEGEKYWSEDAIEASIKAINDQFGPIIIDIGEDKLVTV